MTQEARLPFRTVIQLDPSTHRCQKILGFLNVASCLEFHLSEFSLQQSNMATHTILLVDVFTSCTMYNRYNSSYWIWNRILFWTLDDLSCLFFNLILLNCQTLHLPNQKKRIPMPNQRSWIPSRYVQHWFFFHILPHRTTRNVEIQKRRLGDPAEAVLFDQVKPQDIRQGSSTSGPR